MAKPELGVKLTEVIKERDPLFAAMVSRRIRRHRASHRIMRALALIVVAIAAGVALETCRALIQTAIESFHR